MAVDAGSSSVSCPLRGWWGQVSQCLRHFLTALQLYIPVWKYLNPLHTQQCLRMTPSGSGRSPGLLCARACALPTDPSLLPPGPLQELARRVTANSSCSPAAPLWGIAWCHWKFCFPLGQYVTCIPPAPLPLQGSLTSVGDLPLASSSLHAWLCPTHLCAPASVLSWISQSCSHSAPPDTSYGPDLHPPLSWMTRRCPKEEPGRQVMGTSRATSQGQPCPPAAPHKLLWPVVSTLT